MNILITGGCGYIGSHTCLELLKNGHSVVVVDNLVNSSPKALERTQELAGQTFPFYEADCRDREAMDKIFTENKIDAVIHFAGLKAVGESVAQPLRYYDNNLNATLTLCQVMAAHGCKRIVFSSSATVYSAGNQMPLSEESQTGGCTNPYGWTKYMGEVILRDMAFADPEWSVVLLRYFNPIGAHKSGRIGENPNGIPNNLMPYISQVAVGKREKLTVFGNDYPTPDGTCIRDYIHVLDLARGHVAAINYAADHKGTEVFNLGTGKGSSVLELVNAFQSVNDIPVPYTIGDRRAGDQPVCYADPAKAKEVLGWEAIETVETMCQDSWNWQRQNPNGYEG
jgi:UDP-glucose 4-epimerase